MEIKVKVLNIIENTYQQQKAIERGFESAKGFSVLLLLLSIEEEDVRQKNQVAEVGVCANDWEMSDQFVWLPRETKRCEKASFASLETPVFIFADGSKNEIVLKQNCETSMVVRGLSDKWSKPDEEGQRKRMVTNLGQGFVRLYGPLFKEVFYNSKQTSACAAPVSSERVYEAA